MNPEGYEFVSTDGGTTGLQVLSPDISLNQARLTCTGHDANVPSLDPVSAPTVTLEVAGE